MALDVNIGSAFQPTSGLDVWISTSVSGTLLDFTVPYAPPKSVLAIVIVRGSAGVNCSDLSWTKVIDGVGASGQFLDVYARAVDGTEGSNEGDVISFLALAPQEMQGGILVLYNCTADALVYEAVHQTYSADTTPPLPSLDVINADDTILCVWSSLTIADLECNPTQGFTEIDDYGSSSFETRSLLIGTKRAEESGTIDPGQATSVPPSSGRAFTLGIRFQRILFGHAARAHPIGSSNPSGHARKT